MKCAYPHCDCNPNGMCAASLWQDTADAFVYGIGPAFAYIKAQREGKAARQEFDLELIRKPNGSYGL